MLTVSISVWFLSGLWLGAVGADSSPQNPHQKGHFLKDVFCPVDGAPPPGRPRLARVARQGVLCAFGKSLGLGADVRTLGL